MVGEIPGGARSLGQGGTGGGPMWNCPCRGLPSRWAIWKTRAASRVTGPLLKFLQTKIAPMSGYNLSVLWPSSLSARLSRLNSHTKTKLMLKHEEQLHLLWTRRKNIMKKCNNCVESSVFIIPSLFLDRDDLLVTNCVDLNWGPLGEPFHHSNSTGSNSHDLMHCRMPEICCLCFLFSPSNPFSSTATEIHNRKKRLTVGSCSDISGQGWNVAYFNRKIIILAFLHVFFFFSFFNSQQLHLERLHNLARWVLLSTTHHQADITDAKSLINYTSVFLAEAKLTGNVDNRLSVPRKLRAYKTVVSMAGYTGTRKLVCDCFPLHHSFLHFSWSSPVFWFKYQLIPNSNLRNYWCSYWYFADLIISPDIGNHSPEYSFSVARTDK